MTETLIPDPLSDAYYRDATEILDNLRGKGYSPARALATLGSAITLLAMGMKDTELLQKPLAYIIGLGISADMLRMKIQ